MKRTCYVSSNYSSLDDYGWKPVSYCKMFSLFHVGRLAPFNLYYLHAINWKLLRHYQ